MLLYIQPAVPQAAKRNYPSIRDVQNRRVFAFANLVGDDQRKIEIVGIIHDQIRGAVAGAEIVVAPPMRLTRGSDRNSRKHQDSQKQKPHIDRKRPR
jgi:hypothetical protein